MKYRLGILLFLICIVNCVHAQSDTVAMHSNDKKKSIDNFDFKKSLVIAGLVVQQTGSTLIEYDWWWKGTAQPFHFEKDGFWNNYSLGLDKFGHAFTSYAFTVAINESMKWADFSEKTRLYTGIALPAFWALSIEIGDAMSPYGFSLTDLAANFSGIAYGTLQEKYPSLKNVMFKYSYYPAERNFRLSERYDYHIYWLTFNMHNILPSGIGKYWPELINLAAGYGIEGWNSAPPLRREFMVGIDLNLQALKTKNKTLTAIRNSLDIFHIPMPGIKYTEDKGTSKHWLLFY